MIPSTEWMSDALCAQVTTEEFFPEKGGSTKFPKSICAACPVRDACLQYSIDTNQSHGIWGGLSERERRPLRRAAA